MSNFFAMSTLHVVTISSISQLSFVSSVNRLKTNTVKYIQSYKLCRVLIEFTSALS